MNGVRERELPYTRVIVTLAPGRGHGDPVPIGLLVSPWEIEFGWDRMVAEAKTLVRHRLPRLLA